ncbi:Hypothetical protein NTJ_08178 [Nesidiocoris tenuis]|uniref:Uncharacterized protein n=1 Tax=Nesidiocoris tenuis TaxID=355587 RepID=A0ABN7AVP3_9HEMI|nr:Hypothetical protein NTJ_08178 [Nesidiocoris tenuis]
MGFLSSRFIFNRPRYNKVFGGVSLLPFASVQTVLKLGVGVELASLPSTVAVISTPPNPLITRLICMRSPRRPCSLGLFFRVAAPIAPGLPPGSILPTWGPNSPKHAEAIRE